MNKQELEAFVDRFLEHRRNIQESFKTCLTRELQDLDLSVPHLVILRKLALDGDRGETRMADLARHMGASPAMVTHLVDRLEKHALVARRRHPTDRRVVTVTLRPAGKRLLERFRNQERDRLLQWLGQMDERDRQRWVDTVRTLRELMEKYTLQRRDAQ